MRFFAVLVLVAMSSLGCTVQGIGYRCVQDEDCDTSVAVCRSELNPMAACAGSDCVCTLISSTVVDAGATTDTGTVTDTGTSTDASDGAANPG